MFKLLLSGLLLYVWSLHTLADVKSQWDVSGFATQGFTYTNDNNYLGKSDDSISTDFTEFGVNLSRYLTEHLRFTAQGAYRNSNALDDDDFFLDLLLLDYQFFEDDTRSLGGQLGRIKPRFGLYNTIADISAVWPTAVLPQAFYPSSIRSILLHIDGASVNGQWAIGDWSYRSEIHYGTVELGETFVSDRWYLGLAESPASDIEDLLQLRVEAVSPDGSLNIGIDYMEFGFDVTGRTASNTELSSTFDRYTVLLFMSKRWLHWQLDVEGLYGGQKANTTVTGSGINSGCTGGCNQGLTFTAGESNLNSSAFYASLYRFYENGLSVYVGYGASVEDSDDPKGEAIENESGIAGQLFYLRQSYVGFRYDLTPQWSLAAKASYFQGASNLARIENSNLDQIKSHWHALNIVVSYKF